jgi:argininosuccinate synthase
MGLIASDLRGKTIGLASSGGLDSCTSTRWLTNRQVNVVSLIADLGQPDEPDLEAVGQRMLACGAVEAIIVDAQSAIAEAGLQVIQAQAKYEGGYWNTTGIARHVTVAALLPELRKRGIKIFSHGATGRGNDQVRFQLATNMLMPEMQVYAPWRDSAFLTAFGGRKEMIAFCKKYKLPVKATLKKPYSTDANMLGLTHEAGELEFLTTPADFVAAEMGVWPQAAPEKAVIVEIQFHEGKPIYFNGEVYGPVDMFKLCNQIAGRHGIGIGLHTVENRFVGIKSRGVYEAPGMELLGRCYEYLLQAILDRRAKEFFDYISLQLAKQIYQGYWFDKASQMLRAALSEVTKLVTGTISVKLYKGNIFYVMSGNMPHSIYSATTSSMEKIGDFNHEDSEGFLRVLGVNARALAAAGQIGEEV